MGRVDRYGAGKAVPSFVLVDGNAPLQMAWFRILDPAYRDIYGNHLRLERVRLFETPNCWADAVRAEQA